MFLGFFISSLIKFRPVHLAFSRLEFDVSSQLAKSRPGWCYLQLVYHLLA